MTVRTDCRILFLDFDGVLHPERPSEAGVDFFCRMHLIEEFLLRWPGLRIVVSSSWRERYGIRQLREFFPESIRERVVGRTPIRLGDQYVPDWLRPYPREAECRAWMRRRASHVGVADMPNAWVALDDQPRLFRPFCGNLVVVDFETGLVPRTINAVEWLLHRLSE